MVERFFRDLTENQPPARRLYQRRSRDTARMTNCWASWKASDYAESEHGPSPPAAVNSMEIRHNRGVGMLAQIVNAGSTTADSGVHSSAVDNVME